MSDDAKAIGLLRRALAPLLREELMKAVADDVAETIAPKLDEVLTKALGNVKVEIDTKALDAHIQQFLQKRDTHIKYEPKIELAVPELAKVADILKATAISDYRPHDQDSSDGAIYNFYGFVHPSGSWYIMRSSTSDQRYTAGTKHYDEAWRNRDKAQYRLIDEAFNG